MLLNFLHFQPIVTFLIGPGICGIVCVLIEVPLIQKITFVILMLSCVAPNVINAAIIDVFPTTVRGMAVCLISGVLSTICNV